MKLFVGSLFAFVAAVALVGCGDKKPAPTTTVNPADAMKSHMPPSDAATTPAADPAATPAADPAATPADPAATPADPAPAADPAAPAAAKEEPAKTEDK